jgi:hypothetical protein
LPWRHGRTARNAIERGFYVNGALLLQANDSSHTNGISGLVTNKAAAQFDNYLAYQP